MGKKVWKWVLAGVAGLCVAALLWTRQNVWLRDAVPYAGPSAAVQLAAAVPGLRLHVFETGRMKLDAWAVAVGASGERHMDQPAFLIEHPQRGLVLFEAGHHSEIAHAPAEHLGLIYDAGLMPMAQQQGQDARSQLRRAGFDPDQIGAIVVSHFHPEHVGAVEEFPRAKIVADAREIAWGRDHPDYNYVPREYDAVQHWQPIDFADAPPFGPFPAAFDLFGDGSLLVISTPGHTPGHVSVLVNLAGGPVLLTGDVAWTELNLTTKTIGLPFVSSDGLGAREALGKLLRFHEDHPEVLLVPGHDLGPLRRAVRADITLHAWPPANAAIPPARAQKAAI